MTTAVVDANVLYSALLRDRVLRLAIGFAPQPRWTAQGRDEPDLLPLSLCGIIISMSVIILNTMWRVQGIW